MVPVRVKASSKLKNAGQYAVTINLTLKRSKNEHLPRRDKVKHRRSPVAASYSKPHFLCPCAKHILPTSRIMDSFMHLFENEADDVNLSPDQAREVFKLLGLDLTEVQIQRLEDVPLDEFMRTLEAQTTTTSIEVSETEPREEATISYNQLHEFLRTCNLDVPQETILDFLAQQSNSTITEADPLVFDKEGFTRFLQQLSPSASPAQSPAKPSANPRTSKKKSKSKARRRHKAP